MLEIIAIVKLTKMLAARAQAKGRSSSWGALLPLFWIGGEILGFVIGALVAPDFGAGAYLIALLGAVSGAGAAFLIVSMLGVAQQMDHGYVPGAPEYDPSNPYSPPTTY